MLISINNVSVSFNGKNIINNADMTIDNNTRYGLIGVNGAGKSTLLNILLNKLTPDDGEVVYTGNPTIGFLEQNTGLERNSTIIEEMRKVFAEVIEAEVKLRKLEKDISNVDHNTIEYKRMAAEYANLQAFFDSRDGYNIDVKIKTILNGMGFIDKELDTNISTLSGGEKTRLAIARLLLESPDLLILDEPTNHLDFKTLNWLENYLLSYKGAILVVSHDRYFLDKLVNNIYEIERGVLYSYSGNYSAYLIQKEERRTRLEKEYEAQQEEISKLQTYVDKNISRASTSNSAKSRLKILENMDIIDKPSENIRPIKLKFETVKEPYKDVLTVNELELRVGEEKKLLCDNINLSVKRHEKIAIIGDNGIGKSTFLKTIQEIIPHYKGEYTWGKNTSISYYEQENLNLNSSKIALDELWDRFPHIPEAQIRKVLGSVHLRQEDVYKPVSVISGGERARLALCVLMLEKSNVMLLDEPTNHLDLASKEVLEEALREYDGTLIFISHDRYLLNKIPDKIVEMKSNGVTVYDGNYDYYISRSTEIANKEVIKKDIQPKNEKTGSYRSKEQRRIQAEQKNRIREIENSISQLEQQNEILESDLAKEEVYSDYILAAEKTNELESNNLTLEELYTEWELLQENLMEQSGNNE